VATKAPCAIQDPSPLPREQPFHRGTGRGSGLVPTSRRGPAVWSDRAPQSTDASS